VTVVFQAVIGDDPHFIVTNGGPKPGGISAGKFQIKGATAKTLEVPLAVVGCPAGETFVKSGESREIEMFPTGPLRKLTEAEASRLSAARCVFTVQVVQYSGKTKDFFFERGCTEFIPLVYPL
jgi:hypothetical protein